MARVSGSVSSSDTDAGKQLAEALAAMAGAEVWIGIRSTKDPDSHIVRYAAANEFGSVERGIPERSFMRSTVDEQAPKYARMAKRAMSAQTRGDFVRQLDLLGVVAVGDVQQKITSNLPPPNAPATIARKKSSGTLRDTGRMLQSIGHESVPGDERR